jgi:hypothetical protein
MRLFSAMLRLLTGLVILGMSARVMANNLVQIRNNGAVGIDLYGQRFRVDGHALLLILLGMALIGLGLVVYGVVGLLRHRRSRSVAPKS